VNAASDIAVIRTRLPYVDRRALSQAWYSALHHDEPGQQPERSPLAVTTSPEALRKPGAVPSAKGDVERANAPASPRRRPSAARGAGGAPTATVQASKGERQTTGRTASLPTRRMHGASFTVNIGEARVRIVARAIGNRLTLVAVCSGRHAEIVRRALAHASLGLREAGAFVDATVHCQEDL